MFTANLVAESHSWSVSYYSISRCWTISKDNVLKHWLSCPTHWPILGLYQGQSSEILTNRPWCQLVRAGLLSSATCCDIDYQSGAPSGSMTSMKEQSRNIELCNLQDKDRSQKGICRLPSRSVLGLENHVANVKAIMVKAQMSVHRTCKIWWSTQYYGVWNWAAETCLMISNRNLSADQWPHNSILRLGCFGFRSVPILWIFLLLQIWNYSTRCAFGLRCLFAGV
jgi:hypothetical protein